jgi:fructokinase
MKHNRKPIVVGLGEVLWDMFPDAAHFGGAPANFACHAAALGADGYIVSAVGPDTLGMQVFEEFRLRDVHTEYLQKTPQHATGTVNVLVDPQGHASYHFASDTAWDNLHWTDSLATLAQRCDAVCFGSLAQRSEVARTTIYRFLSTTKHDCLRVFDVNLRQDFYNAEVLDESLKVATLLKLNDDELPIVANLLGASESSFQKLLPWLSERYNLQCIALTRGASGSVIFANGTFDEQVGRDVKVVDTVGAGDAFTAALVVGFLNQKLISDIHQTASDIAAFVCTQRGATPLVANLS